VKKEGVAGSQFTCFTSTKVQILTPEALCVAVTFGARVCGKETLPPGTQFTCFTSTKVQILTARLSSLRCSHCPLLGQAGRGGARVV
jgi:hypothetical protein